MKVDEIKLDIPTIVDKWRSKPGSLIMILHEIENTKGYVPREASIEISKCMDVPLARIYEVLTFYTYFKLEPPGKHSVSVCMGTACYLKGGPILVEEIKNHLKIKEGETTPDKLFHLESVRCVGCCGLAPTVVINDKVYGGLKKGETVKLLEGLRKQTEAEGLPA